MFTPLYDAAWALIGHEQAATEDPGKGFFSPDTIKELPTIPERTAYFAKLAKGRYGADK
jgi:hypothetical protein